MKGKTSNSRFATRNLALVCVFAPLCTIFSFWSLFPIFGAIGTSIKVTAVIAPLIGIILGPYMGAFAVALGGAVGTSIAQTGPFGALSFIPWMATAFCSGLLYSHKWRLSAILYSVLLLMFTFYPTVGPAWLHPYLVWFQLIGLAVLLSPLQLRAVVLSQQTNPEKLIFGVAVISFISALFGQIAGSLMFEMMYWPTLYPELDFWASLWQTLTFVYPIERTIITVMVAFMGAPLIKALRAWGYEIGGK